MTRDLRAPYRVAPPPSTVDLDLRGSEGPAIVDLDPAVRRYPDAGRLERQIAQRWSVEADRILVTAGADDALDRVMRTLLGPREIAVLPVPSFEMTERYARLAGGEILEVPWEGAFPLRALLRCPARAVVLLTSPNNPTGEVIPADILRRLTTHFRWVVLDLAYVEYAELDPTAWALQRSNVVVVRTFSKAYGLAGLRVGWTAGPASTITTMRASGLPYPVSIASLQIAEQRLEAGIPEGHLERNARTRQRVTRALVAGGLRCPPSSANFVYATGPRSASLREGLEALGIGIRTCGVDAVRIGIPDPSKDAERLLDAIAVVLGLDGFNRERP